MLAASTTDEADLLFSFWKPDFVTVRRHTVSTQTYLGKPRARSSGDQIALDPPTRKTSNPFAYFVNCVRHKKPTEEPLSGKMNVEVMEILDTERKSVRTGRQEKLR
jgi:hypothetical protein